MDFIRFKDDEMATLFLLKHGFKEEKLQSQIAELLDRIPPSRLNSYGKSKNYSDTCIAANYYMAAYVKDMVVDVNSITRGGGHFKVVAPNPFGFPLQTSFTLMPGESGKCLAIFPTVDEPSPIEVNALMEAIEDSLIEERFFTKGKLSSITKRKLTKKQKQITNDFKRATKYLREVFAPYGITSPEAVMKEAQAICDAKISEKDRAIFPKGREGTLMAAASYVEDNIEEVEAILASNKHEVKEETTVTVKTGTIVISLKDGFGLKQAMLYCCYLDPEDDIFYLIPVKDVDKEVAKAIGSVTVATFMTATLILVPATVVTVPAAAAMATGASLAISSAVTSVARSAAASIAANQITAPLKNNDKTESMIVDNITFELKKSDILIGEDSTVTAVTNSTYPIVGYSRENFSKLIEEEIIGSKPALWKSLKYNV